MYLHTLFDHLDGFILLNLIINFNLKTTIAGFDITNFAIVVGLVHIVTPFMVLSILAALEKIDPLLSEASATLGANRFRTLWYVILPLALPGIGAGTTIVFSLAISAYVTPLRICQFLA